jgi:hypothetical protein
MGLIERLEAKRREVDEECRDPHLNRETYLWWCDLRDILDEAIEMSHPPLMMAISDEISESDWVEFRKQGYIEYRRD